MSFSPAGEDLPGVDPAWSRFVRAPDGDGVLRTWHVLDNQAAPVHGTLLCVHGNPTWSYLWRRFLAAAPPGWRVVAVDQLGMGWSERLDRPRTFAQRVADLGALTEALPIDGLVVLAAHDWGGPIGLGWALAHRSQLAGLVLANTGVHLRVGALPPLIGLARSPGLRAASCVRTPAFVRGATALSRPALPKPVRDALALPYPDAPSRRAIGDFVADIPVEADHPSRAALEAVAEGVANLDVPALLLWGPRDPVFGEEQLSDLQQRLPQADVQRYPRASHLVTEDVPASAEHAWQWIADHVPRTAPPTRPGTPVERLPWAALLERAGDPSPAVVELRDGQVSTTSFAELEHRIETAARGLAAHGVRLGDRVALLVPPGVDLTVAVYACWRIGAVIVVADAGLGVRGLGHALRSAAPDHVIGITKALLALGPLRVPGRRIPIAPVSAALRGATGWLPALSELSGPELSVSTALTPLADRESAVLFTSGATGPAKGVVYHLGQLSAQIELVGVACGLGRDDRLVAAFAPFALYGPALGIGAAVPDMDVTAPGTLTAVALAQAVAAVSATVVFASPAALRNVVTTAGALTPEHRAALTQVRRVLSAGAPVPLRLLRQVQQVLPAAELHTPYGMTEALPVTDISLAELEAVGVGNGVCVGHPLPGVRVALSPLDPLGRSTGELTDDPEVTGEICVAAAHVKDHYDRLWVTQRESARNPGWHRTGDVGHLDADGRLWVEGRGVHVISAPDGPITPVGIEQRVEAVAGVSTAAVVGVGPAGTQQVVVVVVPKDGNRRSLGRLAAPGLAAAVRAAAGVGVAAVLVSARVPTDIRHNSKIDRSRIAAWATAVLAGERAGRL